MNTVLAALKEYDVASGRKYARHGERVTAFAATVEGFIGDLMLARNNTPAGGWVFRPLHRRNFIGSEITYAHISAAIAGLVSLIDSFVEQLSQVFMLRFFHVGTNC